MDLIERIRIRYQHYWRRTVVTGVFAAAALAIMVSVVQITTTPVAPLRRQPVPARVASTGLSPVALDRRIATELSMNANVYQNIPYCSSSNAMQTLDLYVPKASGPHPLVIFIHGGGWTTGSKADPIVRSYAPDLINDGAAFASIDYRRVPQYRYPAQDNDVSCALSFLYNQAATYSYSSSQWVLFGASAGGQLAAYSVLEPSARTQIWHPSINGVVDFYGIEDLTDAVPGSHLSGVVDKYTGDSEEAEHAASPADYATASAPPFLIFHGNKDPRVPLTQSQELVRKLTAVGAKAQLVIVQHGGHGWGQGDIPSPTDIRTDVDGFISHLLNLDSSA